MGKQLELFETPASFDKLIDNVVGWAADKNILKKKMHLSNY